MMSEESRKILSHTKQNDRGPNYFGYYKHSALNLFCQNEDIPFISGLESRLSAGTEIHGFSASGSFFSDPIVEGLSNIKKEKLRMLLKQSVVCIDQEIDEIHGRISAMFQIDEALMGSELCISSEDLEEPESSRSQRPALLGKLCKLADMSQSESFRKVYEDFQVLMHVTGLEAEDAIDKCFADTLAELDLMEQNLEEYLNILASKCRKCLGSGFMCSLARHSTELLRSSIVGIPPRSSSQTKFMSILKRRIIPHYGDCISTSKLLLGPIILRTEMHSRYGASHKDPNNGRGLIPGPRMLFCCTMSHSNTSTLICMT